MQTVLLVIHLMIAASLVGVVLLQKSEGGALGIGGGGGGGFLTGRGQANLLTRITAALALAFFASSISLSLVGKKVSPTGSVFDNSTVPASSSVTTPAAPATDGAAAPAAPAPATDAPASGAPATGQPAAPRGGILDKLQ
jgi:preprotein translocase subunit SecG